MKRFKIFFWTFLVIAFSISLGSCNSSGPGEWLIPSDQVVDGGPGKDGIPSIDNPQFVPVSEANYVGDNRLVVGIKIDDVVRAYPHQMMDRHEIANDKIGNTSFALTYCPLTGTAIGWNRTIDSTTTEFGVSGLLFRNNLIPYDRNTDSEWSQMQLRAVRDRLAGQTIETVDVIETIWATWKQMYPNSEVLALESGVFSNSAYGEDQFLYGRDYGRGDSPPLFPRFNNDNRFPTKKRFHGVIASDTVRQNADVKLYDIDNLGSEISIIEDSFQGIDHIIVGSSSLNIAASFKTMHNGTELNFEAVQDELPVVMTDQEGNKWDVFGYAVSGPREGEKLTPTKSYTGYWFAWVDFFPELEVHSVQIQ